MRVSCCYAWWAVAVCVGIGMSTPLHAGDPVRIELHDRANTNARIVTLGAVAKLDGGDAAMRSALAQLDLTDRPAKATSWTLSKRHVEFRLKLAGYSSAHYSLQGPERVTLAVVRDAIPVDRVVAVAREELLKRLGQPPGSLKVELVQPVAVALPEVADDDTVTLTATPQVAIVRLGRTQMNVTVLVNGEKRLVFPVFLESVSQSPASPLAPLAALPRSPMLTEPLIKAQQRVTMSVRAGELIVSAQGDAMQDGRLGQKIRVLNIDSKKVIQGTVSGPGTVDVELMGGSP